MLNNKTVLITGGTGSLGKVLARKILEQYHPRKLIIFSRCEYKQALMAEEFNDYDCIRFFLGDVRDKDRLLYVFDGTDYMVHCLPPRTKIITDRDVKNIEDIEVGDNILTEEGKFWPVTQLMSRDISEDIVLIRPQLSNIPIRITKEHPVLIWRPPRICPNAGGRKTAPYRKRCSPACNAKYQQKCRKFWQNIKPKWVLAEEVKKGDFVCYPRIKDNKQTLSPGYSKLLGYYIAEGCISYHKNKPYNVRWSFNKKERNYIEDVKGLCLKLYKKTPSSQENGNSTNVCLCGMDFASQFVCGGRGAANKKIPPVYYKADTSSVAALLSGYFNGDGCKKSGRMTTVSLLLAYQLRLLFHKIGVPVRFVYDDKSLKSFISGKWRNCLPKYMIGISKLANIPAIWSPAKKATNHSRAWVDDDYIYAQVRSVKTIPYKGRVYNFSVKNSETYTAEGIVVHNCAALKRIDALEYNPTEAIKTNIIGSMNVVEAAMERNVKRAILISTDKAVAPLTIYGATKLTAERLFLAANTYNKTDFLCVRYGNVLGSRGSVIERFLKLKKEGKKFFPITDGRATRFWITLGQAAELIILALERGQKSSILVPKLPTMSITQMARAIEPECIFNFVGLRTTEKIHETLIEAGEPNIFLVDLNDKTITPYDSEKPYMSNTNNYWLSKDDFRILLKNE